MVTITIGGADKSGALARIAALLVRKGYPITGQHLAESGSGSKLVKISMDVSHLDKVKLAAELKDLAPEYNLIDVEGSHAVAAPSIREIATRFPKIAPLVQAYGDSFGPDTREQELFAAGKKIGAFQYEKEWSFGTPLKMPTALRRTLVPALEALTKVDATDTDVSFPDSPLCSAGKNACCEFVGGFMQGFLDAGPLSAGTRVQKAACKAKGDPRCTFKVNYDL